MAKILGFFLIALVLIAQNADARPSYQILPPRAGYIPVYIRYGNQPLSEIHPLLAEAFREHRPHDNLTVQRPDENKSSRN